MSSPDDYGKRRQPIFGTRDGKPGRALELLEVAESARDLDEAATNAHLRQVEHAVAQVLGPTRLQEIAGLLLALPYGDFVEMSEGIKSQGSEDLARLIHQWAKANARAS
jgi:hypothetical protein